MAYNTLIFNSVTFALKAQGVLENAGIKTRLEKLKKEKALHGCGYGLKIKNSDIMKARNVLEKERIRLVDIIE